MSSSCESLLQADGAWGPVSSCRSFDFTIRFESAIFSILPAALLIVAIALDTLNRARKRPVQFKRPQLRWRLVSHASITLLFALLLCISNVVRIALVIPIQKTYPQLLLLPASILETLASLLIFTTLTSTSVSFSSSDAGIQTRSALSRALISFYLTASALLQSAQLRTSLLAHVLRQHTALPVESSVRLGLTILLLYAVLSQPLNCATSHRNLKASIFQRLLYLHLLPLLWRGRTHPIPVQAMDPMIQDAKFLSGRLYQAWSGKPSEPTRHDQKLHSNVFPLESKGASDYALPIPSGADFHLGYRSASIHQQSYLKASDPTSVLKAFKGVQILIAMFRASPGIFLSPIIPKAFFTLSTILKPILVERTLSFVNSYAGQMHHEPSQYGYGLVGAFAIVYLMAALAQGQYLSAVYTANCKVRGMLVQTVCLKSLALSVSSLSKEESMSPTALMSVDVERIVVALDAFHEFWSALIVVPVATFLLYRIIGLAFVATIIAVLASIASIPLVAHGIRNAQSAWSSKTDARVTLITTLVKNIRAIKMLAYEQHLFRRLIALRSSEVDALRTYGLRLVRVSCFSILSSETILLATMTTFSIMAALSQTNNFTPTNIFAAITILAIIDNPLFSISAKFAALVSALSSLSRIETFLNLDESPRLSASTCSDDTTMDLSNDVATFRDACLAWSNEKRSVLRNVTLTIARGDRIAVTGPGSSGKSSLLCALLGELNVHSGGSELNILRKKVGYMSQTPWICEALSIRENIVLGGAFDQARFDTASRACGLHPDFEQLVDGASTPAKNLSGGQQQRIALCRAVYLDADVLVLDDPLSAVDAVTSRNIISAVFSQGGLLRGKTVIVATHSVQLQETCTRLLHVSGGTATIVPRAEHLRMWSDKGKHAQRQPSSDDVCSDSNTTAQPVETIRGKETDTETVEEDDIPSGRIQLIVFKKWLMGTGIPVMACYFLLLLTANGMFYAELYYLQSWSGANDESSGALRSSLGRGLGSLMSLQVVRVATYALASWLVFALALPRAAGSLHRAELYGLLCRPYAFFQSTSPGILINRFTQDLFVLDYEFSRALTNFVFFAQDVLLTLITMIVPAPYLLIAVVFAGACYYGIYTIYAPNSRHLRRLEMATKSPLHTHFAAMSEAGGLLAVRASQQQASLAAINAKLLDRSQKPYFLLWQVRGWLQTWLFILAALLNVMLVLIAVLLRNSPSIATLGVALVSATSLANMLNFLLMYWTEAEIASVALERISELATLPADPSEFELLPKADGHKWGQKAQEGSRTVAEASVPVSLQLENVYARYSGQQNCNALTKVSFTLRGGQRVGICGRTGSGKSTLLLVLLGMLKPSDGHFFVDGMDASQKDAHWIRQQARVVPQDPLILPTTLRENLDPGQEGEISDDEMWRVLRELEVGDDALTREGGLDTRVGADSTTESQRQLINVARAILQHPRLLVLDEATSSMDLSTDKLVQNALLRECKRDCPPLIISVAHRIDTIIDYDLVLVLDQGRVAEFGPPSQLLEISDGIFWSYAQEQRAVKSV